MTEPKRIKVSEILNDLKSGLTRWRKEDIGFGNIEEKYGLKFSEMKQLINHPKIKGVRTLIPSLIIVDDTDELTSEVLIASSEIAEKREGGEQEYKELKEEEKNYEKTNNVKTFI